MTIPAQATPDDGPALSITGLQGGFDRGPGRFTPVLHDVTLSVPRRGMTAIVGETGSGKTLTALSVLGLTPPTFRRTAGSIVVDGIDVSAGDETTQRRVRGRRAAMVFQDSRAALNPVFTIGTQLGDVCQLHRGLGRKASRELSEHMLERVGVPEPRRRLRQYPHELSGGTVQRIQLAMALVCRPSLLLLDEPTTGLDVTIQADILELIVELIHAEHMSACMITHDLGVVAETCDHVVVMRSGRVVESGTCRQIVTAPEQPYTVELLAASRFGSDTP